MQALGSCAQVETPCVAEICSCLHHWCLVLSLAQVQSQGGGHLPASAMNTHTDERSWSSVLWL